MMQSVGNVTVHLCFHIKDERSRTWANQPKPDYSEEIPTDRSEISHYPKVFLGKRQNIFQNAGLSLYMECNTTDIIEFWTMIYNFVLVFLQTESQQKHLNILNGDITKT